MFVKNHCKFVICCNVANKTLQNKVLITALPKNTAIGKLLRSYCNGRKIATKKRCKTLYSVLFDILLCFVAAAIEPIFCNDGIAWAHSLVALFYWPGGKSKTAMVLRLVLGIDIVYMWSKKSIDYFNVSHRVTWGGIAIMWNFKQICSIWKEGDSISYI